MRNPYYTDNVIFNTTRAAPRVISPTHPRWFDGYYMIARKELAEAVLAVIEPINPKWLSKDCPDIYLDNLRSRRRSALDDILDPHTLMPDFCAACGIDYEDFCAAVKAKARELRAAESNLVNAIEEKAARREEAARVRKVDRAKDYQRRTKRGESSQRGLWADLAKIERDLGLPPVTVIVGGIEIEKAPMAASSRSREVAL